MQEHEKNGQDITCHRSSFRFNIRTHTDNKILFKKRKGRCSKGAQCRCVR